jgi:uncharacterized protein
VELGEAVRAHPEGACLRVRAVPGARATEVAGLHGGALRVRVAAPPVGGRANAALLGFLAARLGLRPRDLRLAAGGSGRDKLVVIPDRTPQQVRAALAGPAGPDHRDAPDRTPRGRGGGQRWAGSSGAREGEGRVDSHEPARISTNPATIPPVSGSSRMATPRATATAGFM